MYNQLFIVKQSIRSILYLSSYSPLSSYTFATTTTSIHSLSSSYKSNMESKIKGVIFDLDGTLTEPVMDFKKLRRLLGIEQTGVDVLDIVNSWPDEQCKQGHQIIYDFELEARNNLIFQDGLIPLLNTIDRLNISRAIHSRNSKENIEYFCTKLIDNHKHQLISIINHNNDVLDKPTPSFYPLVGREVTPPKPHPQGCLYISKLWSLQPNQIIFVGDSKDDMLCSNQFGSISVLLQNQSNSQYSSLADVVVNSLNELNKLLESNYFDTFVKCNGNK